MMHRATSLRLFLAAGLTLALASGASAQVDQTQELSDVAQSLSVQSAAWQTFTPSLDGKLLGVDVKLGTTCFSAPCTPVPDLSVEIVATSSGVPTSMVLGSTIVPASAAPDPPQFVHVDLGSLAIFLNGGETYAIRLSSAGAAGASDDIWNWQVKVGGDPYANGELFSDIDSSNGLDDPAINAVDADAAFRTYMRAGFCGNGTQDPDEQCDDGAEVNGDGCSESCVGELCGDGVVNNVVETCDDDNATDGDGCASCALEKSGLACQAAIVKGGQKYAAARLKAILKCRLAFAAGKPVSITNPRDCAAETAAARSIAKAGAGLRKAIANGNKPKCTDPLVAALGACAETVDGLVTPDGAGGCLRSTHDAAVEAIVESQLGE
jgi:cysteine-rich repeat protein